MQILKDGIITNENGDYRGFYFIQNTEYKSFWSIDPSQSSRTVPDKLQGQFISYSTLKDHVDSYLTELEEETCVENSSTK